MTRLIFYIGLFTSIAYFGSLSISAAPLGVAYHLKKEPGFHSFLTRVENSMSTNTRTKTTATVSRKVVIGYDEYSGFKFWEDL